MQTRLMKGLLVFGLSLTVVFGQDVVPSLSQGSRAILFSFSGLGALNAGTFDGGVGGRYYLSDAMSVRGGLQFTSANVTNPANPGTNQQGTDGSASATSFGLSAAAEWHMGKGRVVPYYGAGVMFSTASTEFKSTETGNPPPDQTTIKNRGGAGENVNGTTYAAGSTIQVFALAGVEFFLYKELSLSAEYQIGYGSISRSDQEASAGNTTVTTKIGSGSLLGITTAGSLTLSVYVN